MPVPKLVFEPPFNVVRCSHVVLAVRDLAASRVFYADIIGLQVADAESDALYLGTDRPPLFLTPFSPRH